MLRQELQLKLKLNLNLLLKNQVEVLLYPIQELEQILKEEKESNPFIEEVYVSPTAVHLFEERRFPEPVHRAHPLEVLERNVRAELEGTDLRIALELLSCVDEKGFFRGEVESIANELGVSPDRVEKIRRFVTRLEPLGICTRDAFEFAFLQVEELYPDEPWLVEELKRALGGKRPSEEAMRKLSHLRMSPIESEAVIPRVSKVDAVIELDDGELVGYIYEELIEIRPNTSYVEMLSKAKGSAREFLKEYFERYENFKKILSVRRENLRRILDEIIRTQEDFLRGEGSLRPLLVKDVAYRLGISESTVSRLINSKYVKTPQGTYPFKFFFVRETAGGVSQEELMREIKEIVSSEDKSRPLSDEEIANILRKRGYNVARRTVAKYREMLGIPSSRERRKR